MTTSKNVGNLFFLASKDRQFLSQIKGSLKGVAVLSTFLSRHLGCSLFPHFRNWHQHQKKIASRWYSKTDNRKSGLNALKGSQTLLNALNSNDIKSAFS